MIGALAFCAALGAAPAPTEAPAALERGDQAYGRRAEGARDGVAQAAVVDEAIRAYREALAAHPESGAAVVRLLRAMHFRASFCGASEDEQKALFAEAAEIGQRAVDRLEVRVAPHEEAARLAALRALPDAASVYYWSAACWGQWGLLHGKLASARKGIAGKVRTYAQTSIDLDPRVEEGGGFRLLGRLHDQAPRIPLLTGWVSHEKAIPLLRRSLAIGPENVVTRYFLADAILLRAPADRREAVSILEALAGQTARPGWEIEEAYYARRARERLAALK
jgi:tetratricopeptide (TPR) repeat protein